jgi:Rod binding domain-containing protein
MIQSTATLNRATIDRSSERAVTTGPGKAALSQHEQLTKQAQKWVAQTFYGTLLKQMHDSPFRSELFDGGRGGQAFSSLYDQQLVDHMARGAGGRLSDGIVRRLEARLAYNQAPRDGSRTKARKALNGGSAGDASNPLTHARMHVTPGLRA